MVDSAVWAKIGFTVNLLVDQIGTALFIPMVYVIVKHKSAFAHLLCGIICHFSQEIARQSLPEVDWHFHVRLSLLQIHHHFSIFNSNFASPECPTHSLLCHTNCAICYCDEHYTGHLGHGV
jgi:hypothetical protein